MTVDEEQVDEERLTVDGAGVPSSWPLTSENVPETRPRRLPPFAADITAGFAANTPADFCRRVEQLEFVDDSLRRVSGGLEC